MMEFASPDPQKHHRRSIRLKGYDYTKPGAYFVTIVTARRAELFGSIVDGEVHPTPLGCIVKENGCDPLRCSPRSACLRMSLSSCPTTSMASFGSYLLPILWKIWEMLVHAVLVHAVRVHAVLAHAVRPYPKSRPILPVAFPR